MPTFDTADERVWKIIREQMADDQPHAKLRDAKLRVAYTDQRPGAGCLRFGRVKIMTDWERHLTGDGNQENGDDIVVLINRTSWASMGEAGRVGCIDHLLSHLFVDDEKGGFGIAQHDIYEFGDVLKRHGAWDAAVVPQYRAVQQMLLPSPGAAEMEQVAMPAAAEPEPAEAVAKPKRQRKPRPEANGAAGLDPSEVIEDEASAPAPPEPYRAADGGEYTLSTGSLCPECRDGELVTRGDAEGLRCPQCGSVFRPLDAAVAEDAEPFGDEQFSEGTGEEMVPAEEAAAV